MREQLIVDGGVQYIPSFTSNWQIIFLDFDGEFTRYNGEILTVDRVEVADPQLTQSRIVDIVTELNALYAVDAFEDDVNEKIFEDKHNGMLA